MEEASLQNKKKKNKCSECGVSNVELASFGEKYICSGCKPFYLQKVREGIDEAHPENGRYCPCCMQKLSLLSCTPRYFTRIVKCSNCDSFLQYSRFYFLLHHLAGVPIICIIFYVLILISERLITLLSVHYDVMIMAVPLSLAISVFLGSKVGTLLLMKYCKVTVKPNTKK